MNGWPVHRRAGADVAVRVVPADGEVGTAVLSVPGSWGRGEDVVPELHDLVAAVVDLGYLASVEHGDRLELAFGWMADVGSGIETALTALLERAAAHEDRRDGDWTTVGLCAPDPQSWTRWGAAESTRPQPLSSPRSSGLAGSDTRGSADGQVQVCARAQVPRRDGERPTPTERALDSLFCFVLGGVPSSRLQTGLRDDSGFAYYVSSLLDGSALTVVARCRSEDEVEVCERIRDTISGMAEISAGEVVTACDYFASTTARNRCNPLKSAAELVSPPGIRTPREENDGLLTVMESFRTDPSAAAAAVSGRFGPDDFSGFAAAPASAARGDGR